MQTDKKETRERRNAKCHVKVLLELYTRRKIKTLANNPRPQTFSAVT